MSPNKGDLLNILRPIPGASLVKYTSKQFSEAVPGRAHGKSSLNPLSISQQPMNIKKITYTLLSPRAYLKLSQASIFRWLNVRPERPPQLLSGWYSNHKSPSPYACRHRNTRPVVGTIQGQTTYRSLPRVVG